MSLDHNAAAGLRRYKRKDTVTMSQEAVTKLEVAFAEFKGAVSSDLRNLSHDVKNLTQALEAVVPRREHEQGTKSTDERLRKLEEGKAVNDRLSKLEGWQNFMIKQTWVQWAAGMTLGGTVVKKLLG